MAAASTEQGGQAFRCVPMRARLGAIYGRIVDEFCRASEAEGHFVSDERAAMAVHAAYNRAAAEGEVFGGDVEGLHPEDVRRLVDWCVLALVGHRTHALAFLRHARVWDLLLRVCGIECVEPDSRGRLENRFFSNTAPHPTALPLPLPLSPSLSLLVAIASPSAAGILCTWALRACQAWHRNPKL